jgi:hypothetical protein
MRRGEGSVELVTQAVNTAAENGTHPQGLNRDFTITYSTGIKLTSGQE